jgi:flavin reductase (DIM6/NTAB) family NADH-FMN oxidoreductase RutF
MNSSETFWQPVKDIFHNACMTMLTSEFRTALGQFATGVTIVTTRTVDGLYVGLTASSFNSVSLTPPLVLWSLARSASAFEAFQACSHYAIHVLAADQGALAQRFATKGIDRFANLTLGAGLGGAPILEGTTAVFECTNHSRHEGGDHLIFVGRVERCTQHLNAAPLIYHRGEFFTQLGV